MRLQEHAAPMLFQGTSVLFAPTAQSGSGVLVSLQYISGVTQVRSHTGAHFVERGTFRKDTCTPISAPIPERSHIAVRSVEKALYRNVL